MNVTAKSAALHSEWDDAKSYEEVKFLDLAILKLNKPIGAERGYVKLVTNFNRAKNLGKTITFAGYPQNTHGTKDSKMHKSSGQVRQVEGPRLFYNNLTFLGMGGAALLVDDGINPTKCVGVHTFAGFAADSLNGGIAITTKYLKMINAWVAELDEIDALRAEEKIIKEQLAQFDSEINELDKIASEHGYNLRKRN